MEKILIIKEVNNQTLVITDDKEEIIVNEKTIYSSDKVHTYHTNDRYVV